jgi:hypothetical protein
MIIENMTTFLQSVDGRDHFVKCDDCRGLHNILDVDLITDTIVLCKICSDRIKKGVQRASTLKEVSENVKTRQEDLDELFWSKKDE